MTSAVVLTVGIIVVSTFSAFELWHCRQKGNVCRHFARFVGFVIAKLLIRSLNVYS